jgi:hypothetical protein
MGAAGPDFSLSASPWRAARDKWDRHLTEEALANAPEGTTITPAPDSQDKHRCAHYPHCIEHGEVPLTPSGGDIGPERRRHGHHPLGSGSEFESPQ